MLKSNLLKNILLTAGVFLLILGIHKLVNPTNEWVPLLYAVPIIGLYLFWLIRKTT